MRIINGDSLEVLKTLPDESVDSIVTDPPYELGFMGKKWDNTGIAYNIELWKECLRVLKSGGHLLAFSGTRTYHRMAVAIEDAGFEVRDMIEWVYGSGFPKSLNIGKAIDKLQGNERAEFVNKYASRRVNIINSNASHEYGFDTTKKTDTKGTSEWEGWGTALKPAHEPICMARKPLSEKTVAENVLKHGTGGINIDGCRVPLSGECPPTGSAKRVFKSNQFTDEKIYGDNKETSLDGRFPANTVHDGSGAVLALFPESKGQQGVVKGTEKSCTGDENTACYGKYGRVFTDKRGDEGSAARFFYCAKASTSERNEGCEGLEQNKKFVAGNYSQSPVCKTCDKTLNGTNDHSECSGEVYYREMESRNTKNNHPTVKPISLMRYLCRLVTPKGGLVLDPFGGSGTTGIGAVLEGFDFILIEQEEEYVKIAEARIAYWSGKGVAALSGSVSKKPVNNVKSVKQDNLVQVKLTDLM